MTSNVYGDWASEPSAWFPGVVDAAERLGLLEEFNAAPADSQARHWLQHAHRQAQLGALDDDWEPSLEDRPDAPSIRALRSHEARWFCGPA